MSELLTNKVIILGMSADPEPEDSAFGVEAKGTIVLAHAAGPKTAILLKCHDG